MNRRIVEQITFDLPFPRLACSKSDEVIVRNDFARRLATVVGPIGPAQLGEIALEMRVSGIDFGCYEQQPDSRDCGEKGTTPGRP